MSVLAVVAPLAVTAGFVLFLWHRLAVAPRWPVPVRVVVALVLVGLAALVPVGLDGWGAAWSPATMRPFAWVGQTFLAACLYLALGLGSVWLVSIGTWLVRRRQAHGAAARRRLNRVGSLLVVAVTVVVTGHGVAAAARPSLTEYEVASPALPPELDGLRVALVTDIHAGAVRGADFTQRVVDLVQGARPDLVVVAGDLVEGPAERYAAEIAPLAGLTAPLGVFATTGNHEMYTGAAGWVAEFERLGLTVLRDESVRVGRDDAAIRLAGVDDLEGTGTFSPDLEAALEDVDPDEFALLAAHQPRQALDVEGRGVDVQLSGHTHGGQLWPLRYLVPLQQPAVDGVEVVAGTTVVTSRGVGAWGPPVRVAAAPEVPVVTLRRGPAR